MDWHSVWAWLAKASTSLGLPAFVVGLASVWWNHRLANANERVKADLGQESERLSAELQQALKEHEVRFSALHARRVAVLAKLYRRLLYAHSAFMSMTDRVIVEGDLPKEERERLASQKWGSFRDYFNLNRIWLDEDVCDEIDRYVSRLALSMTQYGEWKYYTSLPRHAQDMAEIRGSIIDLHKRIQDSRQPLSDLLNILISRFRELL